MSLWSSRKWSRVFLALVLGLSFNPVLHASEDEPAREKSLPAIDEPASEKPATEDSGATDEEAQKPEAAQGQVRQGAPVLVPVWQQFGGRFQRFFRRNVPIAGGAIEASEGEGEAPRSVVLPDNGDMRRRLESIKGQVADGHFAEAAGHLGQLLQNPEIRDFFLGQGEERRNSQSFQAEIRKLIAELPSVGRAAYLVQFEAVAKQQLNAALEMGGESALRDVVRRFPLTHAGYEAQYRLGHYLWDHGRTEAAITCLERLRSNPAATEPFEPGFSRLLAASREHAGATVHSNAAIDGWTNYRGNPERNRSIGCGPPLLAARWTREVVGDRQTQRSIEHFVKEYREGRGTYVPMLHPLAIGDLVLMRTARGVAAFDVSTGDHCWQHPTDDDADNAGLDRVLWSEPAGGAFAADAECFYLVEALRNADGRIAGATNSLAAREHYRSRQGRLRWEVGGIDGGDEPALAGVTFLGPPVSWQGRLYAQVEGKGAITLVVLNARTGRLLWSQELALVEQPLRNDPFRRLAGATPSISTGEIIVCPTAGGVVVAVDLTMQSLAWAYRYGRRPQTSSDSFGDPEGNASSPGVDQHDRWLDGTVTLGRDCVVLTPPESADLHCVDLKDGRLRWSRPRIAGGLFVACVTDRLVVIAEKSHVRALNLADGQPAWETPISGSAFTSGRGVFTGDSYYLPVTSGGIVQFDVQNGKIGGEYRSDREIPPGNLIWHRGLFLSQGPDFLEAFDEREVVERQVRETLANAPRDVAALLRRGDLELTAGRLDEALAAFRQADAVFSSSRTRSRLTSALLDGLRQDVGTREQLLDELDRLAER